MGTYSSSTSVRTRTLLSEVEGEASAAASASASGARRSDSTVVERSAMLVLGVGAADVKVERTMAAPEKMAVVFILIVGWLVGRLLRFLLVYKR